ncbi:alpha/beta hydrolase [Janthinobacterium sp. 17J80-10]|uniref:alpha/beta hydrolase n=1 Tax=Janthinobacterium sp. 17J80-10 TaxID=2497863 RepID=UPI0013E8EC0D|nr:alpha/beta hydrolase [Janthinobacterium sp. 17J80-10]
MIGFAFCHGWSFDAQAIAPLRQALLQRLPDAACASFDLGFHGAPQAPQLAQGIQWIALGHSYGFAWLLQQPQSWHAAISLNGFTRFCRHPGHPEGTPVRLLQAMQAHLERDAQGTVRDFQAHCGMPSAPPAVLDQALLQEHLGRLRDLNLALPDCPILALATRADAIVPPALTHACFAGAGTLQEFGGDHMQLLREPATAADAIAAFIRNLHA